MKKSIIISGLKKADFTKFRTFYNSKKITWKTVKSIDNKAFTVVLLVNEEEENMINSYLNK